MVNLITMMVGAVMGQWVRWGLSFVSAAYAGASSIVSLLLRAGLAWALGRAAPLMRQQLINPAVQLGRQPGEHILEVGIRVMPAQLDRLQQAHHDRSALTGQLTAHEEPIFATYRPGPHLVLDVVVIDRHSPVVQKAEYSGPT